MPRAILFPKPPGSKAVRFALDSAEARFLPPADLAALRKGAAGAPVHVFGKRAKDKQKWKDVAPGDIVLFVGGGGVHEVATVLHTAINRGIAMSYWPTESLQEPWDHLIFVARLRPSDFPYERLNTLAGYARSYVPQGWRVMSKEHSEAVLRGLGLS
jgi:hypothetical protein